MAVQKYDSAEREQIRYTSGVWKPIWFDFTHILAFCPVYLDINYIVTSNNNKCIHKHT